MSTADTAVPVGSGSKPILNSRRSSPGLIRKMIWLVRFAGTLSISSFTVTYYGLNPYKFARIYRNGNGAVQQPLCSSLPSLAYFACIWRKYRKADVVAARPPYVVSFVHLSDIHWDFPSRLFNTSQELLAAPGHSTASEYGFLRGALHQASTIAAAASDKTYLVLGGDNIHRSCWDGKRVATLSHELLLPTVNLTSDRKAVFHGVIAVPGNHDTSSFARPAADDVDTQGTSARAPDDNFHEFKLLSAQLQANTNIPVTFSTPFESPLLRIAYGPDESERFISVWAVNSAEERGLREAASDKAKMALNGVAGSAWNIAPKAAPCCNITWRTAVECQNALAPLQDTLRIAVLHHNNLPPNNDDSKRYPLLNVSAFNQFLLDNRFRVILHGHDHVSRITVYNRSNSETAVECASHLSDGFLAIGAPAFNLGQQTADRPGFNVIRLELDDCDGICRVSVTTHLLDRNRMVIDKHVQVHRVKCGRFPCDRVPLLESRTPNRRFGDLCMAKAIRVQ